MANRSHLADDLYQEFFLSLCEIKDNRLIDAVEGGYLEVFCYGIIHNIWSKRNRVKVNRNGNTSPLHLISGSATQILRRHDETEGDNSLVIFEEHLADKDGEYDFNLDVNELVLNHIIDKYKESENIYDRFRSRVFYYSKFKYRSIRQFSNASQIPYSTCRNAYKSFNETIKKEICKY